MGDEGDEDRSDVMFFLTTQRSGRRCRRYSRTDRTKKVRDSSRGGQGQGWGSNFLYFESDFFMLELVSIYSPTIISFLSGQSAQHPKFGDFHPVHSKSISPTRAGYHQ